MQAVQDRYQVLPRLILMPKKTQTPPTPLPAPKPGWWQRHGNTAQIVSAIASVVALVGLFVNLGLTLYFHYTQPEPKVSDEHVNTLIDAKLKTEVEPRFTEIDKRLIGLSTDIENIKKAVQTLADNQSHETQKIIERLLQAAQQEQNRPATAKRLLSAAELLILALRDEKSISSPEFFEASTMTLQKINAVVSSQSVNSVLIGLAEYRAAIAEKPMRGVYIGEMHKLGEFTLLKDSVISGQNAIQTGNFRGFVLDKFILDNVTFEDVAIGYAGGPVVFRNVRFVNCRFMVPASEQGKRILIAAINQPANAQIGNVPNMPS